jgi:transcription termination factor Rho
MELGELDSAPAEDSQQPSRRAAEDAETSPFEGNDLSFRIVHSSVEPGSTCFGQGTLEVLSDGWGFLRHGTFQPHADDIYVSQSQIKRFGLWTGDWIRGQIRPPKDSEKYYGLLRVDSVNLRDPDLARLRADYADLTTIYPHELLRQETGPDNITARFLDLIAPIGKGQRGLIVSPPKAGKTSVLKSIARSVAANNPEVIILVLLVDERPEEVTDIRRSVNGQVVSSTFDELPENHILVAQMVLEEAKRLVESGHDVLLLLDSITRLSRASNLTVPGTGRTLSGGLDPSALHRPKRFFGAARNIEQGGSLTIIATALVDTGSRMDEMIFEEFKGTGNWEVHLDRALQERRVFPAIDIKKSGTRHDELLHDEATLKQIWKLHRALSALDTVQATELLIDRLRNTRSNEEFLKIVDKTQRAAE